MRSIFKNAIISCLRRPSWILGDILKKIIKMLYTSLCSLMSSKKIYTDLIIKKKVVTPIDPLNNNNNNNNNKLFIRTYQYGLIEHISSQIAFLTNF